MFLCGCLTFPNPKPKGLPNIKTFRIQIRLVQLCHKRLTQDLEHSKLRIFIYFLNFYVVGENSLFCASSAGLLSLLLLLSRTTITQLSL